MVREDLGDSSWGNEYLAEPAFILKISEPNTWVWCQTSDRWRECKILRLGVRAKLAILRDIAPNGRTVQKDPVHVLIMHSLTMHNSITAICTFTKFRESYLVVLRHDIRSRPKPWTDRRAERFQRLLPTMFHLQAVWTLSDIAKVVDGKQLGTGPFWGQFIHVTTQPNSAKRPKSGKRMCWVGASTRKVSLQHLYIFSRTGLTKFRCEKQYVNQRATFGPIMYCRLRGNMQYIYATFF